MIISLEGIVATVTLFGVAYLVAEAKRLKTIEKQETDEDKDDRT